MANKRLIPKRQDDEQREPHDKFNDLASKIFTVPKSELDKREQQWRSAKTKPRKP